VPDRHVQFLGTMTTANRPSPSWGARFYLPALAAAVAGFFILVPPIPQDQAFHHFADARNIAGLANFWNVVSNLPFAVIGIIGLWRLSGLINRVLFAGVLLTSFGSAYYHWLPTDTRLVWDRLPMTVIFMSFLAYFITEKAGTRAAAAILAMLLLLGAGSVFWWSVTNDLRPYAVIKFGAMLFLLPFLSCSRERAHLAAVLGLFGLAQLAELWDRAIYTVLPVSGHTVKHLLAAMATYYILRWRQILRPATP